VVVMWKRRGSHLFKTYVQGVPTRSVSDLVNAMGGAGVS